LNPRSSVGGTKLAPGCIVGGCYLGLLGESGYSQVGIARTGAPAF